MNTYKLTYADGTTAERQATDMVTLLAVEGQVYGNAEPVRFELISSE